MSIPQIGPIAFGGTVAIISFFQSKQLLASSANCAQCGVSMTEQTSVMDAVGGAHVVVVQ